MVIGDTPASPAHLLNCECAGLSAASNPSYAKLNSVRNSISQHFGADFCNLSGYKKFTLALHISVLKGSHFFDIDHLAGIAGSAGSAMLID